MPIMIAFMIKHFANGFLLGAAAALATILVQPDSMIVRLVSGDLTGLILLVFAFGSGLGMGSLATALWLDTDGTSPDQGSGRSFRRR